MRQWMMLAALTATLAGPAAAQRRSDEELTAAERRRLEAQLDSLRDRIREVERTLGRARVRMFSSGESLFEPMVWSFGGNRARLGVVVRTEDSDQDQYGAELSAVTPGGPAHGAGLRAGDVITRLNGQSLANGEPTPGARLIELMEDVDVGDTVRVEYRRDGRTQTVNIVAGEGSGGAYSYVFRQPEVRMFGLDSARGVLERALVTARGMPGFEVSLFTGRWSDLELTTLDQQLGSYFGTTEGVLVVKAPRDSLLGLQSGDVILRIGGRVPSSPSHAIRILRSYEPGDEIRLEIMRQRARRELRATLPPRSE